MGLTGLPHVDHDLLDSVLGAQSIEYLKPPDQLPEYCVATIHVRGIPQEEVKLTPVGPTLGISPILHPRHTEDSLAVGAGAEFSGERVPRAAIRVGGRSPCLCNVTGVEIVEAQSAVESLIGKVLEIGDMPWSDIRKKLKVEGPSIRLYNCTAQLF